MPACSMPAIGSAARSERIQVRAGAAPFGAAGMRWSPTHQHLRWTVTAKKFFVFLIFFVEFS